jgi:xanthine dehydrogenase accessory factor
MQFPKSSGSANLISQTVLRILQEGASAVLVTLVEAPAGIGEVGNKLLVDSAGVRVGSLGAAAAGALDEVVARQAVSLLGSREETRLLQVKEFAPEQIEWREAKLLFERIQAEPRLVICGAGHVGASLAKLASLMGYRATLIDDRAEFVTREHFVGERIELVAATNWAEAVGAAVGKGRGVCVAIVTRGHSEDEECLRAAIPMNADYVGLIGSRRRTDIVLQRLRESGADEAILKEVRAPVGLDIGAVTPEEVALAIMAEIVSVRRGGKAGSLSEWRRNQE